jgi:hypothetical protein
VRFECGAPCRVGFFYIGFLNRLEALMAGDLITTKGLTGALPSALDLSPEVVGRAIEDTRRARRRPLSMFL